MRTVYVARLEEDPRGTWSGCVQLESSTTVRAEGPTLEDVLQSLREAVAVAVGCDPLAFELVYGEGADDSLEAWADSLDDPSKGVQLIRIEPGELEPDDENQS